MNSSIETFNRWSGGIVAVGIVAIIVTLLRLNNTMSVVVVQVDNIDRRMSTFVSNGAYLAEKQGINNRISSNLDSIKVNSQRLGTMEKERRDGT